MRKIFSIKYTSIGEIPVNSKFITNFFSHSLSDTYTHIYQYIQVNIYGMDALSSDKLKLFFYRTIISSQNKK